MTALAMLASRLIGAVALVAMASAAQADGDAARGEKKYEECVSCHMTERGAHGLGPSLYGVFDRFIAGHVERQHCERPLAWLGAASAGTVDLVARRREPFRSGFADA